MQEPQTISQVIKSLEQRGYREDFKTFGKLLKATPSGLCFEPENLLIDYFYRFEGETDLNEESIIFALSCPQNNIKGIYLVAFGRMMDNLDAKIVHVLQKRRTTGY